MSLSVLPPGQKTTVFSLCLSSLSFFDLAAHAYLQEERLVRAGITDTVRITSLSQSVASDKATRLVQEAL